MTMEYVYYKYKEAIENTGGNNSPGNSFLLMDNQVIFQGSLEKLRLNRNSMLGSRVEFLRVKQELDAASIHEVAGL